MLVRFFRGDVLSGKDVAAWVVDAGVGVFEKKPRSDFWPLAEPAFLRLAGAGVLEGALLLGGIVSIHNEALFGGVTKGAVMLGKEILKMLGWQKRQRRDLFASGAGARHEARPR